MNSYFIANFYLSLSSLFFLKCLRGEIFIGLILSSWLTSLLDGVLLRTMCFDFLFRCLMKFNSSGATVLELLRLSIRSLTLIYCFGLMILRCLCGEADILTIFSSQKLGCSFIVTDKFRLRVIF